MADLVDDEADDKDTVDEKTLDQLFSKSYKFVTETAVSLKKSYVNHIHGTKSLKLAASQSDNTIELYELTQSSLSRLCKLSGHPQGLTQLVFSPKADNLLFSSGEDGVVKLWDLRAGGSCSMEYKDEEEELMKPYTCMDVSCNGRVVCAGSQVVEDDVYLVFFDERTTKPLGGYWNAHTDDITQVKFHETKREILVSGAMDNLLNVFNIMEQTEDEALLYSLNIENSVQRLTWLGDEHVSCITQSNDLQIWNVQSGDVCKSFTRDKVAKSIKRSKEDDCYLVDMYTDVDSAQVLLAGSYGGDSNVLRSVLVNEKKLQPCTNFKNNEQTVGCCWYEKHNNLLVTGGESGLLTVWRGPDGQSPAERRLGKPTKLHDNRSKPY